MPGKPIQALKTTGSINPLILIDEVIARVRCRCCLTCRHICLYICLVD
jgi:hypothetical protein